MPFGEKRLFQRRSCSRMVSIDDFQSSYGGHMHDLTVDGAFIEPSLGNGAQIGQELILTIPFAKKHDHLRIRARVAWTRINGIGVRFIKSTHTNRLFE